MNIILFAPYPEKEEILSDLIIRNLSKYPKVYIHRTLNGFYRNLRGSFDETKPPIVIILIPSRQYLDDIYSNKELFSDKRLILVLPDDKDETVSLGFKLFPRFVTYSDSDGADICSVIENMISKERPDIYEGKNSSL